jgi:hypothetical protein
MNNEAFQRSIGFDRISQDSLKSYFRLTHLRAWIKNNVIDQLKEGFLGKPNPHGYLFGFFRALERAQLPTMQANAVHVKDRIESIAKQASALGSSVLVVLVPAPAQVCNPGSVEYWPKNLSLNDSERFDLEQPQRLAKQLLDELGLNAIDLRTASPGRSNHALPASKFALDRGGAHRGGRSYCTVSSRK